MAEKSAAIVQRGNAKVMIEAALTRLGDGYVRVGILHGSDPHLDAAGDSRLTIGDVAAIHEFGAPSAGIPPRSFVWLGTQIARPKLKRLMPALVKKVQRGDITMQAALRQLAEVLLDGMRQAFKDWQKHWPPLAQSTADRKGHEVPLIDTRQLYEALEYEIRRSKA